ncbi:MAG TPA: dephospho-CoA kinase [Bryobacteraceae bacterium]|jgi:dephospho-CoA kinase|nr:dephospho-CoA kinase [Bryobacteraceae bacterium]
MLRVGLTGGLASGKSFVGHALAELGCYLIEADKLGHEVMQQGAEAYDAIVQEFGGGILDPNGQIDRRKLSALVWDHPERLEKLNSFVHPAVWAREERRMDEIAQADPHAIAVVEAAILVETGSYKRFDKLIVVTCTAEQQMERAMKRGSYSKEEVLSRISRQLPLADKVRVADYVIDTSGSKESTLEQVRAVYETLRSLSV